MTVRIRFSLCLLAVLLLVPVGVAPMRAAEADGELQFVLVLSRHGVRAPLDIQQDFGKYSAQPWPKWNVPPGDLTPHGRKQMELMGAYYRARYVQAGLLSGTAEQDTPLVYFRTNNVQRTLETARAIGAALLPGATPEIHALPAGEIDILFTPGKVSLGNPDRAHAAAAVLGRIGNDPRAPVLAHREAFTTLQRVLFGESGKPVAGKTALLDLPQEVVPAASENLVSLRGPITTAGSIVDSFMIASAEGLPLADVGWGRLTPGRLTELLRLHALWFDLAHATLYPAQAEASNLASHLADTLDQAATGRAVPGAIGSPGQKLVFSSATTSTKSALARCWAPRGGCRALSPIRFSSAAR